MPKMPPKTSRKTLRRRRPVARKVTKPSLADKLRAQPKPGSVEYRRLYGQWLDRLEAAGFDDLECRDDVVNHRDGLLSNRDNLADACRPRLEDDPRRNRLEEHRITAAYYSAAASWGARYDGFESRRDYEIWTLYAEGQTFRDIASAVGVNLKTVQRVVGIYRAAFLADPAHRLYRTEGDDHGA